MFDFQISAVAFHPHEHAVAMGSVQPNSKVLLTSREFINDEIYLRLECISTIGLKIKMLQTSALK